MKWNNIVGQDSAKTYLKSIIRQGRVPHALLFSGPEGTGQLPLALALASTLQCESPVNEEACGVCPSCIKSFKYNHPDVNFVFPVAVLGQERKSITHFMKDFKEQLLEKPYMSFEDWAYKIGIENKHANINAADIRSIKQTLSLKRHEGRSKVMIIWLPEYLGTEGNILLKLIEEPEDNTHLLLVTEKKEAILPTILSRCQSVDTFLLSDDVISEAVMQQTGCSREAAKEAAWLSEGRFNVALQKVNSAEEKDSSGFLDWLRMCYKANPEDLTKWADDFHNMSYESKKHFLSYGLHFLQQCLKAHFLPTDRWRVSEEEKKSMKSLVKIMRPDTIEKAHHLFNDNFVFLERYANAKLIMMSSSLKMHHWLRSEA